VAAPLKSDLIDGADRSAGFALNIGNFDGPFDLLLSLISKHEMDITEVALSKVTDEFISYLKTLDEAQELEQATEFLVIAATLLDLKIAGLLPKGEVVDAEDVALLEARDLLFARLLQYRAFKDVSAWFAESFASELGRTPREVQVEERFREQKPELNWTMSLDEFSKLAEEVLTPKLIPNVGLTHLHAPRVSIREQAAEVISILRRSPKVTFREVIASVSDRAVVVARFLAVLELYRYNAIGFEQESPLGDLLLSWRGNNFDDEQLAALGADYE
jgi:segregation and condensation protein A